jgi:hypothetical protein
MSLIQNAVQEAVEIAPEARKHGFPEANPIH